MTRESASWRVNASPFTPHALLILLPLILLAPIVVGGRVLYWGVPLMQFYPWQHFAAEAWRVGEVPLWNPLVGNGAPLAANLQAGVFYPLNALYLFLPTEVAMGYAAALHVTLAGLFMFAFMRTLGLRSLPALVAAAAFQLSGFLIARLGFLSITATLPWVAAWLWRVERVLQSSHGRDAPPPALRSASWLAIVVGLGLLAGHAQTALYGLILIAAYTVYRSFNLRRWRGMVVTGIGVILGIGLAAIQLLPAAELARESQRAGGLDFTFAMTHSYWPWRLLTLLTPDLFGNPAYGTFWGYDNYWENAAYIGLLPLLLAGNAIGEWWRSRRMKPALSEAEGGEGGRMKSMEVWDASRGSVVPFLVAAALVSLVLAFGWFTPIYPFLFRSVPGFTLFQGPARWLSVLTIALCALAGVGAESMLRARGDLRRSAMWIIIGVAMIGAGVASRGFLTGRVATFPDATLRLGLLLAIGGLLFGLRPPVGDRRFGGWAAALVAVIAIDLLTAHAALNPSIDPALYRLPTRSATALRSAGDGRVFMFDADDEAVRARYGMAVPFPDFGSGEVDDWMPLRETLIANTSMMDGLASAGNFDSLLVGHYVQLRKAINEQPPDVALRLLGLMHVRYLASVSDLDLPVVHATSLAAIYRNDAALPRAWIVPSARAEPDPLAAILDPAFDPRREVILSEPPPSHATRNTQHATRFTLHFLQDTPNAVTIRAASEDDGYLVLTDTWYPGWRAAVDGRPVPILRANVAFRAVPFPAGEHTVQFRYEPDSARLGVWTSAASAAIIFAGPILLARRRRSYPKTGTIP